jgi:hypothetical protein
MVCEKFSLFPSVTLLNKAVLPATLIRLPDYFPHESERRTSTYLPSTQHERGKAKENILIKAVSYESGNAVKVEQHQYPKQCYFPIGFIHSVMSVYIAVCSYVITF